MIKFSLFKSTLKQGLIMGLGFCLYTTTMWLTKLDTIYLNFGQYLDMAIIVLPIAMIFWAIRQENNAYQVTIVQRIVIAIFVGTISFLIYDPFLYTYHHYINPDWFTAVLNLKEVELKAANISEDKIIDTLQRMKASNVAQSGLFRLSAIVPSVLIIPTLIALISIIFIRGKGKR
ncbi:MAG: DUF4199 domain-containing protein [Sediminibacterium sp.]|nr:DUF4199 domain-containing protein [Sediminibacterium sp.]